MKYLEGKNEKKGYKKRKKMADKGLSWTIDNLLKEFAIKRVEKGL